MSRSLPKKNNPLILADAAPAYGDLLTRRRLGRTTLSVKPELVGNSNATKPENLGVFEYVHLRAPLPEDLRGSEIFLSHTLAQHPDSYFLMRRSKDGFVSATGMFKIAFPWAKDQEKEDERKYLKSRDCVSQSEVAGNIWISPVSALELAKEYKMYDWVRALLDPVDIVQSPRRAKFQITPPPKFELPMDELIESQRSCSCQSAASPSKESTSPRMPPLARSTKDVLSTPSTIGTYDNLQKTHEIAALMEATKITPLAVKTDADEIEMKVSWKEDFHIVNPPVEFAHSQ